MTTAPKQDPATRTPWQRLTTEDRREKVRQAVQIEGMTYTQAATALGATSREAIAGVVERASRTADPIVSSSGMQYGGNYRARARWPNGAKAATAKPKAKAAAPKKQPHAGFRKFVALPGIPDAVLEQAFVPARTDVWEALPGSTPIAIEHHTAGCRFPVGEISPFAFCNLPVLDGPYCPGHSALCYRELPTARPRKDTTQ